MKQDLEKMIDEIITEPENEQFIITDENKRYGEIKEYLKEKNIPIRDEFLTGSLLIELKNKKTSYKILTAIELYYHFDQGIALEIPHIFRKNEEKNEKNNYLI